MLNYFEHILPHWLLAFCLVHFFSCLFQFLHADHLILGIVQSQMCIRIHRHPDIRMSLLWSSFFVTFLTHKTIFFILLFLISIRSISYILLCYTYFGKYIFSISSCPWCLILIRRMRSNMIIGHIRKFFYCLIETFFFGKFIQINTFIF